MNKPKHQLSYRIFRHHLPIALLSASAVLFLYITRPYKDVVTRLSFATAYPAFLLLSTTLLLGPINVIRRQRNPVSSDVRRDIGIWAGVIGTLHAVIGQCVHLRGRPWLYYVYGPAEKHAGLRRDLFGFANETGALATMLLIALFATSNDLSLRALGTPRWKSLQRWNYAVFALAAMHTFGYLGLEKQKVAWVGTIVLCTAMTIAIQCAAFWKRRRAEQGMPSDSESSASTGQLNFRG